MKINIIPGQRYGRLTIIKEVEPYVTPKGKPARQVLCKCDCGNESILPLARLTNGITVSCGCLQSESVKTLSKRYEERTGKKLQKASHFQAHGYIRYGFTCAAGVGIQKRRITTERALSYVTNGRMISSTSICGRWITDIRMS